MRNILPGYYRPTSAQFGELNVTEQKISAVLDHLESATQTRVDPGVSLEAHL
jgi:hypothetical protein